MLVLFEGQERVGVRILGKSGQTFEVGRNL